MNSIRRISVFVGILYIIGTVAGICSVIFTGASTAVSADIQTIASNITNLKIGILLVLVMGLTLAFIPIITYPIFHKQNKSLAIGFVVFRGAIEPVTYFITILYFVAMISIGQINIAGNNNDLNYYNSILDLVKTMMHFSLTIYIFGIGAILFYTILYKTKAIPRWLSIWGFIAIGLHILTGFCILFGIQNELSLSNTIMNFPIFLQEMVMAVWLIIKGFTLNPDVNK